MGDCLIADGVPEVLKATRENPRMGASQIKIANAGGIAEGDPLDAVEWTTDEVQACTKAAADFGYAKLAFGTDIVTDPKTLLRMNEEFVHRTQWFTPPLKSCVRQLPSTPNSWPYPVSATRTAASSVWLRSAYGGLLHVNGNPLEDSSILSKPEENLALIMKDGKVYKNAP